MSEEIIELSEDEVWVLGRPNFACSQVAKILIEAGVYKKGPSKAEYEQAVWIHWASDLLDTHGSNWKIEGNNQIKELAAKALNK